MKKIAAKLHIFITILFIIGIFSYTLHEMQPVHEASSCPVCTLAQLDLAADIPLVIAVVIALFFLSTLFIPTLYQKNITKSYNSRAPPLIS